MSTQAAGTRAAQDGTGGPPTASAHLATAFVALLTADPSL